MTNYLLSIDPSIKNTGFTLGEKECELNCKYLGKPVETNTLHTNDIGKPIGINSYNFKDYFNLEFLIYVDEIKNIIGNYLNSKAVNGMNFLNLIIERGTFHSKNGIGYETQEHLRGFIAGQFNKLLTKDMLISPSSGKKGYINNLKDNFNLPKKQEFIGIKNTSIQLANELINEQSGNIKISNHDEADSLLIVGYYLNKESK